MKIMKRIRLFAILALSALCMLLLFGCKGEPAAPTVENVRIVSDGGYGKAGALHRVEYTATEGSEICLSVLLGEKNATAADFAASEEGIVFYTAGKYTVTVIAAKDGMTGSGSATVDISAGEVFLEGVTLSAAAGESYGKVGALHVLAFNAAAGSEITVTVEKDGAAASDAVYDSVRRTLVFNAAGEYTVKVQAVFCGETANGEATITVVPPDPPTVDISVNRSSLNEGEGAAITRTVSYAGSDETAKEELTVLYCRTLSGTATYNTANPDTYTLLNDLFVPRTVGRWRLEWHVESKYGAEATDTANVTCRAAALTLTSPLEGRMRIQSGVKTEIPYIVEGLTENYNVTFDTHGNDSVHAEAGSGTSVAITPDTVDAFTVTVTYRHKVASTSYSVDLDFYSVEDLYYAPAWGEDPFGGMPGSVLTSVGHLIYFDAHSCGGVDRPFTGEDISVEVVEKNVTASAGSDNVEILYGAGNDRAYPYVIVSNYDKNVATGNFTLKMTLTDPATQFSAVAYKTFEVIPTTNDEGAAAKKVQEFIEANDFFEMGDMDFSNACGDTRQNMVLTKTGTIMQRSNPSWALNHNNAPNADFAIMDYGKATANCRLEFDFRLLGANPGSGEVWLGIGIRSVTKDGWVGFFDLHNVGTDLAMTCDINARQEMLSGTPLASSEAGAAFTLRIDRIVESGIVSYTVSVRNAGSNEFRKYLSRTYASATSAGNIGAPIFQYQFTHRNGGGCYIVENVHIEELSPYFAS